MSLRIRINLLVTALMLLFTIVVGAIILNAIRDQVREEIEASTKVTVQLLTTVIYGSRFVSPAQDPVDMMRRFLENLGRIRANEVRLYNALGDLVHVSPAPTYKAGRHAPEWFAALVRPRPAQVQLRLPNGRIAIVPDPSRSILDAWDESLRLFGVAVFFFAAINILVFWLVGRLLRPVRSIVSALSEMKEGHLDARLPAFTLPELAAVSRTFNRMADALERSSAENRRLALVMQQASDAVLIVDRAGNATFWNPAAARFLGPPAGAGERRPVRALAPPGREHEIDAHLAASWRREAIDNVETQRLAQDGTVVDVSLSATPLIDPASGKVIGQIWSMRDITEKLRADEAARELRWNRQLTQAIQEHVERERRALSRELHDEFSQCVTAISTIGMTIANRAGEREPETRSQALTIVSVAGQLYDMVHGMIRRLRPGPSSRLGLGRALEEAVSGWRARHPDIAFNLSVSNLPEILPEELSAALYRIVQESITNVIRHAGATRVDIEVAREQPGAPGAIPTLRAVVADDGCGMSMPAASDEAGFGLVGMRERAEALHGQLRIESRPGEGTRVVAVLPESRDVEAPRYREAQ